MPASAVTDPYRLVSPWASIMSSSFIATSFVDRFWRRGSRPGVTVRVWRGARDLLAAW
jgi:hypothetical protein